MTSRPVVVIFGAAVRPDGSPSGAMRARVEAALALGRTLPSPLYMPTGGKGRYGPAEALVMRDLLLAGGVAPEAIMVEPTARDTLQSARACAALIGRESGPVYVATSGYHMLRCVALLWLLGLPARPGRSAAGAASVRLCKRWFWRLREVPAVPVDVLQVLMWRLRGAR